MSDEQNKTEQPTQHKLDEAKKKGNVPKSQELNTVATLLVFFCVAMVFIPSSVAKLSEMSKRIWVLSGDFNFSVNSSVRLFSDVSRDLLWLAAPIVGFIALCGIAVNVMQSGFVLSSFPLKPDFSKINPAQGFKKIFSKKTLFESFKALLKLLLVFTSIYLFIPYAIERLAFSELITREQIGDIWFSFFIFITLGFAVVSIPCVLLDFWFNRWDFTQKMKMSQRELKDEYKKREGDPEIKQKQKQAQKELLQKSASLSAVKDSDIIITNPTHIAVALKYDPKKMSAPSVISIGEDEFAMKIRSLARKHNVLIMQNKPLARKLHKVCSIGQPVPASCFADLVPVFRKILGMTNHG